jgi:hypothetical protein
MSVPPEGTESTAGSSGLPVTTFFEKFDGLLSRSLDGKAGSVSRSRYGREPSKNTSV